MNKVPYVERGYDDSGLTGECAYLWALFLANEADMEDDTFGYSKWKSTAEQLAPAEGKPMPAVVHYNDLENAIKEYSDKYVYPGSDPQE